MYLGTAESAKAEMLTEYKLYATFEWETTKNRLLHCSIKHIIHAYEQEQITENNL